MPERALETPEQIARREAYGGSPWFAASTHWVYVVGFDNDTVKVGSSDNPRQRVEQHRKDRRNWHVAITDWWVSDCLEDGRRAEYLALKAMGVPVQGKETFPGDLGRAVQLVTEAVEVVPRLNEQTLIDYRQRLNAHSQAASERGSCRAPLTYGDLVAFATTRDLSLVQLQVLLYIAGNPEYAGFLMVSTEHIAEKLGLAVKVVAASIRHLYVTGWLRRDPDLNMLVVVCGRMDDYDEAAAV